MRAGYNFNSRLADLNEFKFDFSLDRIKRVLGLCANPQNDFFVIHVAGSNGKGSVSTFLASILSAHKLKNGLYTSPHLIDVKERIAINNGKAGEKIFVSEGVKLFKLIDDNKIKLTYFEFLTVLAFVIFRREKVKWAVIEAGLGGRYDATNVDYAKKVLSIITSISLEHTAILGKTEMAILREKEMIIGASQAIAAITKPQLVKHMKKIFKGHITFAPVANPVKTVQYLPAGLKVVFKHGKYATRMIEPAQAENISTVLTAVDVMKKEGFTFDNSLVKNAIAKTSLPGRMSWSNKGYYLSVAHNPAAFKTALSALRNISNGKKIIYVFSALKDKDIDSVFKEAAKEGNILFILTAIDNSRAINIGKLEETIVKYGIEYMVIPDNKKAILEAKKHSGLVVIGGSFYLVKKFL
jgi:dihydrofolate synthase/folylpolyglutamate synthase